MFMQCHHPGITSYSIHYTKLYEIPEEFHRGIARHERALDLQVAARDLGHALLDRGEVLGREGALKGEVRITSYNVCYTKLLRDPGGG